MISVVHEPMRSPAIGVIGLRSWPVAAATRRVAFGLLWLFVFMIPADEQIAPIPYWVGVLAALAGFVAVICSGTLRVPSHAHYPFLALLLWSAATYIWSAAPDATMVRLQTYGQLLILVWLIWEFAPRWHHNIQLMRAYVFGSFLPVLDTVSNFLQGNQARTETLGMANVVRYTAGTFNENDLGLVLALSLPFSCYLALSTRRTTTRIAYLLQMGLTLGAIILTGSRMSFAVALLALGLMPFVLPGILPVKRLYLLGGLALAAVVTALLMPQDSWQRLSTTVDEATLSSLDGRTQIWATALDIYRSSPIVGVGASALPAMIGPRLGKLYVAHNTYLSILVELGIIGAALAVVVTLVALSCVYTLPSRERFCWLLALMVWAVGVATLSWEHRKPTWFLFGVLVAHAGSIRKSRFVEARSLGRLAGA